MDNYIALIEALSGFAPDTVTVEVLPGFESITGGGAIIEGDVLPVGEDLGLVNVDGNLNTLGGQTVEGNQANGLLAAGETQNNTVTGDNVAGNQATGDNSNAGEGNVENADGILPTTGGNGGVLGGTLSTAGDQGGVAGGALSSNAEAAGDEAAATAESGLLNRILNDGILPGGLLGGGE